MPAQWNSRVDRAIEAIGDGARVGVGQCTRDLLARAQARVPFEFGDLSRSGRTSISGGENPTGHVSFDTVYAAVQHEDTTLRHQDGRTADYLGGPARENAARYQQWIAQEIARNLT